MALKQKRNGLPKLLSFGTKYNLHENICALTVHPNYIHIKFSNV